jgi:threonine synthase
MQMTTILDKNVHNVAVEGSFDDCQAMVKVSLWRQFFQRPRSLLQSRVCDTHII